MSASATSLPWAAERVPRWSSTGHARARPARSPTSLSTPPSSRSDTVMAAQWKPIDPTSGRNHPMDALPHLAPTPITAVKSP
jgi:hypothetical protein